ncbi:MAG: FdtA/QdtA family cupin domain-containing protein [Clostridiales bacterium]
MSKSNIVCMLDFPQYGDDRGNLVVIEALTNIPFMIKRIFYIYGSKNEIVRGNHANRITEFVLINVAGKSKVKILDKEGEEQVFTLDQPNQGLYLPPMVWKEMYDFSSDAVLLVLASQPYLSDEYIRDYESFVKEVNCDV